jgi:RHS repeat-associated protein
MISEYIYLGDQLLAMIKPEESAYYFHNDHLGTPQILTDGNGNVAWKAVYMPFGGTQILVESVENPFRFPGQYYDEETGLHYNYFRGYNPGIGRYLTPDPIGLLGGTNLFAYVQNNPVNWIDPFGLIWVTTGYKYPVGSNYLRYHWNRFWQGWDTEVTSRNWVDIKRDVIQEWKRDPNDPCRNKEFHLGTRRIVPQTYVEYTRTPNDLVNDPSKPFYYQWSPWVNSPTYEDYPGVKYENLYFWRQGK